MNHQLLKQIILDQRELMQNMEFIPRDYEFEENMNYILVGLRRAGKSTLLYRIARELVKKGYDWSQIIYVNFEDDRILGFTMNDFQDIVETAQELTDQREVIYFFDEIQIVEGWEHFARRMADQHQRVYITGSNAKMLSREMEAALGGRYLSKTIHPFSFREVLDYKKTAYDENALLTTSKLGSIRRECGEFLHFGGLPETIALRYKKDYIKNVYEKIILGDIGEREKINNKMALRLMIKKIAETIMHEISYTTLAGNVKACGVKCSTDVIINYVSYAENACLIFRTENLVSKFAEKESMPRYYFSDNGFLSLFLTDKSAAFLENVVAVHLKRLYGNAVYYYKSAKTGIDVDFFIQETGTAIQAAWSIESAKDREIRSLTELFKKYKEAHRLIIVTMEEETILEERSARIEVIPLYKFLFADSF